jgi:hypothetical protein
VVIPPTPDDNAPSPVASNETGRGKSMDSKKRATKKDRMEQPAKNPIAVRVDQRDAIP